jgi:hypothetical protein
MTDTFPDPQSMADAQSLNVFAQVISRTAVQLFGSSDKSTPEYEALHAYFLENLPKLKLIIERIENDLV